MHGFKILPPTLQQPAFTLTVPRSRRNAAISVWPPLLCRFYAAAGPASGFLMWGSLRYIHRLTAAACDSRAKTC